MSKNNLGMEAHTGMGGEALKYIGGVLVALTIYSSLLAALKAN